MKTVCLQFAATRSVIPFLLSVGYFLKRKYLKHQDQAPILRGLLPRVKHCKRRNQSRYQATPLASETKSDLIQSLMEDSGSVGIESPATFGAVVNSDLRQAAEGDVNVDVDCERSAKANRRASFIPGSSATSGLVKPQRKSVGDVSREPEVAPESPEQPAMGDELPKGDSRHNSHNGNLRRGRPLKGVTVPKPFDLSTSNRPASASRRSRDCLTFGERLVRMATKVPDRFIKRPAGEQPQLISGPKPKPTVPRSPNLRTEARAILKKKTPIGREEEDLAYMKKHQFKARPYRPDEFGVSGEQGVLSKHRSDKPLTKQEPFRLSTGSRPTRNITSEDDREMSKQFKARPLPGSRRREAQFNPESPVLRSSKAKPIARTSKPAEEPHLSPASFTPPEDRV